MANTELKRIFPAETVRLESGEEVSVSPVPFGKLAVFGEALASIVAKLTLAGVDMDKLNEVTIDDVGRIFMVAFDEIVSIMGIVLGKERAWFDGITLADGVTLLTKIIEQNFGEETKKKLAVLKGKIPSIST